MEQFRLAICDDEEIYIENIKQYLSAYISETENEMIAESYTSGEALLTAVESGKAAYDIFLLDVDMPEIRGTEVAKEIRQMCPMAVICFITAYEEYAYEAYRAEALGYLVKPVKYTELRHLLNRCAIQIRYCKDSKAAKERYLEVKTVRGSSLIDIKDVLYIEKRRNQCIFHLEDGEMVSYMTLAEVYSMLDPEEFYYVHQGFVASFSKIKEVKPTVVCFGLGREIPISRKYQPKMREMHMDKIKRLRADRKMEKLV
ncbi:MAG: response regulator transcription factor [Lachnospiraceae bacterium]|nr:response regulator transcription factor [Lachnospiraceae bacterium]